MNTPFRLDQHPRRAQPPLSDPPPGYFDRLPIRVMARVSAPAAGRPAGLGWAGWLGWLRHAPAGLRTSLVATLLLSTFAAAHWLSSGPELAASTPAASPLTSLDAVPRAQLVAYLLAPETPLEAADLAATAHQLGLTRQFLRPSPRELTETLDGQPAEEGAAL